MSITDELREYVESHSEPYYGGCAGGVSIRELLEIADRIDAEHEKAITAAHSNGITEYGSMVAREYIKLPVDADGVPIRVGDTIEIEHNGRVTTVTNINYNEYGWQVYCSEGGGFDKDTRCHHVQPDTWERIIEEAMTVGFASFSDESEEDCKTELVERCKRLAGE